MPEFLNGVETLILSPGVSRKELIVEEAIKRGIAVLGDIKLFLDSVDQPVIGITGSNGKSTVTTMVGLAAEKAGIKVAVGGNLGTPALDLIDAEVELYVLELSSFQLESVERAGLKVAVNLNVSPDHLDRHGSMQAYFKAKQKIFHAASSVVYNLGDPLTQPPKVDSVERFGFGLKASVEKREKQFTFNAALSILEAEGIELMESKLIEQKGLHNIENILALFAIAEAAGINREAVIYVATTFAGLEHRCEYVLKHEGVTYINDSKATNVGSTLAALRGLKVACNRLVLIAGGVAKGADFSVLGKEISECVSTLILIGVDAHLIEASVSGDLKCIKEDSLSKAVLTASEIASRGDIVLFSPACASFDMFKNYEMRGQEFKKILKGLAA